MRIVRPLLIQEREFRLRFGSLCGCQRDHWGLRASLRLIVAVTEAYVSLEGLVSQIVKVGAVGLETETNACNVLRNFEIIDAVCTTLRVSYGGIEDSETIQLDAVALGYQLRNTLRKSREHFEQLTLVGEHAMIDHVVSETASGKTALRLHVGEPTVVNGGLDVLELLQNIREAK